MYFWHAEPFGWGISAGAMELGKDFPVRLRRQKNLFRPNRWIFFQGLLLVMSIAVHVSKVQADKKFSLEAYAGPIWASHWSPREKPPGTSVKPAWREGMCFGLSGLWHWSRLVTVDVGFNYADKGGSHTVKASTFPFGEMNLIYQFRYLEFPILLRTYWVSKGPIHFFSFGGTYLAWELANRYTFHNDEKGTATHPLDDLQRTDFGFLSGAGLEFSMGRFNLSLKYRYSMGFVDLFLDTDPVSIPEFRGVDFPIITLRNFAHLALLGLRYSF